MHRIKANHRSAVRRVLTRAGLIRIIFAICASLASVVASAQHLLPADNVPLDGRTPLVLIHGLQLSNEQPTATLWGNFLAAFWQSDASPHYGRRLTDYYKPYYFTYPSLHQDSWEIHALGGGLKTLVQERFGTRPVVIVAHSMGGLVARSFMQQHWYDAGQQGGERVLRLITLATPHHGALLGDLIDPGLAPGLRSDWYPSKIDLPLPPNKWLRCVNNYADSSPEYREAFMTASCEPQELNRSTGFYDRITAYGGTSDAFVELYSSLFHGWQLGSRREIDPGCGHTGLPRMECFINGQPVFEFIERDLFQTIEPLEVWQQLTIVEQPPYVVGQRITARFEVRNFSPAFVTVSLTTGGRDPTGDVSDFSFEHCVKIPPGQLRTYEGTITLAEPGTYSFFPAYELSPLPQTCSATDNRWNTDVPVTDGLAPRYSLANPYRITVAPAASVPAVRTLPAVSVGGVAAKVAGSVDPGGAPASAWFEWGTSSTLTGAASTVPRPVGSSNTSHAVSETLGNLRAGVTYFFRVVAANHLGVGRGAVLSFTTPASSLEPSVSTSAATAIDTTAATLNAIINPNGASAEMAFDWSTEPTLGRFNTTQPQVLAAATSNVPVSFRLSGLLAGVTYYYRAVGTNGGGRALGAIVSFHTSAAAAGEDLIRNGGFEMGETSWVISGDFHADSRFSRSHSGLGYAYVSAGDGTAANGLIGALYQDVSIPADASSATLSLWYSISSQDSPVHPYDILNITIRTVSDIYLAPVAILSNMDASNGAAYAQVRADLSAHRGQTVRLHMLATTDGSLATTFRVDDVSLRISTSVAGATAPTVISHDASAVASMTATLNAQVSANGSPARVWFEWSSNQTAIGEWQTAPQDLGASFSPETVARAIGGLSPGTTYYFRPVAENAAGVARGSMRVFTTTLTVPEAFAGTGSAFFVGSTTAMMRGTFKPIDSRPHSARFEWGRNADLSDAQSVPAGVPLYVADEARYDAPLGGLAPASTYFYRLVIDRDGTTFRGSAAQFTTDPPPPAYRSLTVTSQNAGAVTVNVTPGDNSGSREGVTPFTRSFDHAMGAVIVAPEEAGGRYFAKWQIDGKDVTSQRAIELSLERDMTLTAVYNTGASASSYWVRRYGSRSTSDFARSVRPAPDGGFVVAGSSDGDVLVLKVDRSGNSTWQKRFGGPRTDNGHVIRPTLDGGFIVAATTESFAVSAADIWLLKLTASGDVQWQRSYDLGGFDSLGGLDIAADGGFVLAGSINGQRAFLMRTDQLGAILWTRLIASSESPGVFSSVKVARNGDFIASGNRFVSGPEDLWIVRIDADGALRWQRTFAGSDFEEARAVEESSGGDIVAAGYTRSFGSANGEAWMVRLDGTGALRWQRRFDSDRGYEVFSSIASTPDDGVIVTGDRFEPGASERELWLAKIDASGSVTWQNVYGDGLLPMENGRDISVTADGSLVVVGNSESVERSHGDILLMALDSFGRIGTTCRFARPTSATILAASSTPNVLTATVSEIAVTARETVAVGVTPVIIDFEECAAASCPAAPTAKLEGAAASSCASDSSTLTASLTGTAPWTLLWSDGYVQTEIMASPALRTVRPTLTTTYSILAITDARCTGVASGSATISVAAAVSASTNGPICPGQELALVAASSGEATYRWTGPDGFLSTQQKPIIGSDVTRSWPIGTRSYTLVTSANGCDSSPQVVQVLVQPACGGALPAPPPSLAADAPRADEVQLTWSPVGGADFYEVYRTAGGLLSLVGSTDGSSFSDRAVSAGVSYLYRVRAANRTAVSPLSPSDTATTVVFRDDPLVRGVPIGAEHFIQLRAAVDSMRTLAGLPPYPFTAAIARGEPVRAAHVVELRSAIDEARQRLGVSPIVYSRSIFPGAAILAADLNEIRNGVR